MVTELNKIFLCQQQCEMALIQQHFKDRLLQGDEKVSVHLMITIQKVTSNVQSVPHQSDCLAADRQGQGDTRLTLTPSVIPNSTYVIMVSD
jgi:hypothetical protein